MKWQMFFEKLRKIGMPLSVIHRTFDKNIAACVPALSSGEHSAVYLATLSSGEDIWIPFPATVVNGRGMTSSVGAASAGLSVRGIRKDDAPTDYQIILPALPTGPTVLNTVFLHADVRGRPYRVEDFRDAQNHLALLPEIVALGAYQMNHVWALSLQSPEGKQKTLAAGDLVVKERRCIVVRPGIRDVRVKLHWLLHHTPDDEVRAVLAPYGKVTEVTAEKWRVQSFLGCGSMTRTAVIRLKPGLTLEDLSHQLRVAGGMALIVVRGRAPLCLRCRCTGHIRRD